MLLIAGLALRVLAQAAYRPALLYIDSAKYLVSSGGTAPEGYQALLRLLDPIGGLALVAAVQHAFGLVMAMVLYTLVIRHGGPRWTAALAAAPVLLDAYQLQLEQTIMPDVLFETVIAAGLALLLWPGRAPGDRPARVLGDWPGRVLGDWPGRVLGDWPGRAPGNWPAAGRIAAGALVLGASTTVREIGGVLIVPAVVFAALTAPRRRRAALAAVCFALPVVGYMTGAFLVTGHFGLASNGPAPEYGRAAAAADCATLAVPADERALCPSPAEKLALGGIDGLLHNPGSPGHTVPLPPGVTRDRLLDQFSLAVFGQQPLRVAASVARDSIRLFALTRDGDPEITNIARWQFQVFYPTYPRRDTMAVFTRLARQHGRAGQLKAVVPDARLLHTYQLDGGYTPGPLYAAALVAGVAGALAGRAGRRSARPAGTGPSPGTRQPPVAGPLTPAGPLAAGCLLVTLAAVVLLLSSDAFEFSWRYQLPAVVMLPLAGALGITAITKWVTVAPPATGGTGRRTRPASVVSGPRAPAVR